MYDPQFVRSEPACVSFDGVFSSFLRALQTSSPTLCRTRIICQFAYVADPRGLWRNYGPVQNITNDGSVNEEKNPDSGSNFDSSVSFCLSGKRLLFRRPGQGPQRPLGHVGPLVSEFRRNAGSVLSGIQPGAPEIGPGSRAEQRSEEAGSRH